MKDLTFHPIQREDMRKRMPDMSLRDPNRSGKAIYTSIVSTPDSMEDDSGGGGAFTSPIDYMKILQSILANDGTLLQSKSIDALFTPQLTVESQKAMMKVTKDEYSNLVLDHLPQGTQLDWGLGGMVILADCPGWRSKGTLT